LSVEHCERMIVNGDHRMIYTEYKVQVELTQKSTMKAERVRHIHAQVRRMIGAEG